MTPTVRRTRHLAAALIAALLVVVSACDDRPSADPAAGDRASGDQAVGDEAAGDRASSPDPMAGAPAGDWPDEAIVLGEPPAEPARIVSLSPATTEIAFAVGAGDRLVGVTRFADHPPQVASIQKVGGMVDPDLEAIVALRPDVVIGTAGGTDRKIASALGEADIPAVFVKMDDLDQTYAGIEAIGRALGAVEGGRRAAETLRHRIEDLQATAGAESPTVLLIYGRKPLVGAGPGTFGHELIGLAGGKNVLAGGVLGDGASRYPKLDIEKVVELDPDHIIDAAMTGGSIEFWTAYDSLAAVKHDRVHLLRDPVMLRPGPRLWQGLAKIRRAIDPTAPGAATAPPDSEPAK